MTGILLATVGQSYGFKPVNTVAPAITGTAQARQTLSCSTGTWDAAPQPITYAYQWKKGGVNISGATSSTYVVLSADVGSTLSCTVTASNVVGSTNADSNTTSTVVANVPLAPTIGTATATSSSTASVTFTAPADNGGAAITSYTVYSSGGQTATGASSPITVSGLSANTNYNFYVRATNSVGSSANSGTSNTITTPDAYYIKSIQGIIAAGGQQQRIQVDSSKNIYYSYSGGYVDGLMAFNSSSATSWQKTVDGPSGSPAHSYLRGTGNVGVCSNDSSSLAIMIVNNSGNKALERKLVVNGVSHYFSTIAQKSNGDYWASGRQVGSSTNIATASVSSAGTGLLAGVPVSGTSITAFDSTFDSSDRYSVVGSIAGTTDSGYWARLASDGTGQFRYYLKSSAGTNTSRQGKITACRSTGSNMILAGVIYDDASGYRSFVMSVSESSPGTVNWAYYFSIANDNDPRIAVDNSGNIYWLKQVGTSPLQQFFCKINSSGSLQWQRTLTSPVNYTGSQNYPDISVSTDGAFVVIASTQSTSNGMIFKCPGDGSKTGSFTGPDGTWTYAAGGLSYNSWTQYTWVDQGGAGGLTQSVDAQVTTGLSVSTSTYTIVDYNY